MIPAFSGITKLTQLPWPGRLATPCLCLPPMYTWTFCARRREGGHRGALRGWSSARPCSYPHLCLGSPGGIACLPCTCPSQHQLHPPGLAQAVPSAWNPTPIPSSCSHPCSRETSHPSATGLPPPGSVQFSDGHAGGGIGVPLPPWGGRRGIPSSGWGTGACLLGGPQRAGLGAGRCRQQSPGVPSCRKGALGSQLCSLIWAPPPVATVAGSGCLGSSLHAGRREGGGWQGPRPGIWQLCPSGMGWGCWEGTLGGPRMPAGQNAVASAPLEWVGGSSLSPCLWLPIFA